MNLCMIAEKRKNFSEYSKMYCMDMLYYFADIRDFRKQYIKAIDPNICDGNDHLMSSGLISIMGQKMVLTMTTTPAHKKKVIKQNEKLCTAWSGLSMDMDTHIEEFLTFRDLLLNISSHSNAEGKISSHAIATIYDEFERLRKSFINVFKAMNRLFGRYNKQTPEYDVLHGIKTYMEESLKKTLDYTNDITLSRVKLNLKPTV